jgi:hypothetical protein
VTGIIASAVADAKSYTDTGLSGKVGNTGDETISGIKVFAAAPVLPAKSGAVTFTASATAPVTEKQLYDTADLKQDSLPNCGSGNFLTKSGGTAACAQVIGVFTTRADAEVWAVQHPGILAAYPAGS